MKGVDCGMKIPPQDLDAEDPRIAGLLLAEESW